MLQSIRDKTSGLLAYVIVGLISIPFLLWGVQEYLGGGGDQLVAKVNDAEISYTDLKRGTQLQQQRMRQMFGGNVPPQLLETGALQQSVLNGLIRDELLLQYTQDSGFRTSDAQVVENIKAERAFHVDGEFNEERFSQLLDAQRMSKAGYEFNVRAGLQKNQFQQALSDSNFVTTKNKKSFLALRGQQRKAQYLVLEHEKLQENISISDEQIQAYYDKNTNQYLTQERVKLAYLMLDVKDLEAAVEVNEDSLLELYEQEQNAYSIPQSRQAAHILIEAESDAQFAKATEKAKLISEQFKSGKSFAELASEFSADTLSSKQGGDLGFVAPGEMDDAFEKSLFALNVDEISEPVKTSQGIHLIKLLSVKEKQVKSFDLARADVEKEYRAREANRILIDKSEQLLTISYESPQSLEPTADAIGSKILFSEWITRNEGSGIGGDVKIRAAAFTPEVLSGKNSEVIELADGKQVVVRVEQHEEASPKPLAEVSDSILNQLKTEQAQVAIRKTGEDQLSKLKNGASLASLGAGSVGQASWIDRENKEIPKEIVSALFRMNPPLEGKPSVDGIVIGNGNYVLLEVSEIKTPEVELTDATELTASAVLANMGKREFDAVYRAIESRADLEVFQSVLKQE